MRNVHEYCAPPDNASERAASVKAALLMWFKDDRAKNPISAPTLQKKGKDSSTDPGIGDFQCSDGLFYGFERRYEIQFRVISGESGDVTTEETSQWSPTAAARISYK